MAALSWLLSIECHVVRAWLATGVVAASGHVLEFPGRALPHSTCAWRYVCVVDTAPAGISQFALHVAGPQGMLSRQGQKKVKLFLSV